MRGPVEAEPHEQHLEGFFFLPSQIFGSSDEVWFLLWWLILCKRLLIIIHCKVLLVSEINCLQSTVQDGSYAAKAIMNLVTTNAKEKKRKRESDYTPRFSKAST